MGKLTGKGPCGHVKTVLLSPEDVAKRVARRVARREGRVLVVPPPVEEPIKLERCPECGGLEVEMIQKEGRVAVEKMHLEPGVTRSYHCYGCGYDWIKVSRLAKVAG